MSRITKIQPDVHRERLVSEGNSFRNSAGGTDLEAAAAAQPAAEPGGVATESAPSEQSQHDPSTTQAGKSLLVHRVAICVAGLLITGLMHTLLLDGQPHDLWPVKQML